VTPLGGLLTSAAKPEKLIAEVLAGTSPKQFEALLGTTLAGEPFSTSTAGELASRIGTTTEGLAECLDTSSSQLPASAMALTAPLTDGKTLGVLDTLDGLAIGVLQEKTPSDGSGGGSGGSGGGSGGSGGAGGGSSGTPSSTTIVVSLPAQDAAALSSSAKTRPAKVRILSRKAKGDAVTLVGAAATLGEAGTGSLTVVCAEENERVLRIFDIAGVAAAIALHRSREEALSA